MKSDFIKPCAEVVRFKDNIIRTSACGCYDGTKDWGAGNDEFCSHNPECTCKANHDPAIANCV